MPLPCTECNNLLLKGIIEASHIKHVLTSPLEHASVRRVLEALAKQGQIQLTYVQVDEHGGIDLDAIETWLKAHSHALLSFMHVNNEIGNVTDIASIGALCQSYQALLHSDTTQSWYCYDIGQLPMHLAVGSAHKFHGPKGIGFVYIHESLAVNPRIVGGHQEFGRRAGTENIAHIVGMAKALELAFQNRAHIVEHLSKLKAYMIHGLKTKLPGVVFNGHSLDAKKSSPHILNISLPGYPHRDMLVYQLDLAGIAVSVGSACMSGSHRGSKVIAALRKDSQDALRFSFSKYTTYQDIDKTIEVLVRLWKKASQ